MIQGAHVIGFLMSYIYLVVISVVSIFAVVMSAIVLFLRRKILQKKLGVAEVMPAEECWFLAFNIGIIVWSGMFLFSTFKEGIKFNNYWFVVATILSVVLNILSIASLKFEKVRIYMWISLYAHFLFWVVLGCTFVKKTFSRDQLKQDVFNSNSIDTPQSAKQ